MSLALALYALSTLTGGAAAPAGPPSATAPTANATQSASAAAALQWLGLVDAQDWGGAYSATGQSFKALNTAELWTATAKAVRAEYGMSSNRRLISDEWVPAPPYGFQIVKFRTMTSNKGEVTETLALSDEAGTWKVVAIVLD